MYDDDHHHDNHHRASSNTGLGILVWIAAFAASWTIFLAITNTPGLTLVFSIFVALVAFDISRRSSLAGFSIFLGSLLVVLLAGIYYLSI